MIQDCFLSHSPTHLSTAARVSEVWYFSSRNQERSKQRLFFSVISSWIFSLFLVSLLYRDRPIENFRGTCSSLCIELDDKTMVRWQCCLAASLDVSVMFMFHIAHIFCLAQDVYREAFSETWLCIQLHHKSRYIMRCTVITGFVCSFLLLLDYRHTQGTKEPIESGSLKVTHCPFL